MPGLRNYWNEGAKSNEFNEFTAPDDCVATRMLPRSFRFL
jgi:hypothetical protein